MQDNSKESLRLSEKLLHGFQERGEKISSAPSLLKSKVDFSLPRCQSLNIKRSEYTINTDCSGAYDGYKLSLEPPTGEYTTCETIKIVGLPFLVGAIIAFLFIAAPLGWNAPELY